MFKLLSLPIICILCCVSCETTNTYVYNRVLDFSDSFTLGVEKNNFGAGFWMYCIGGGFHLNQSAVGAGIRNGHYGLYKAGGVDEINIFNHRGSQSITNQMGNSFIFLNSNQHRPLYPDVKRSRKKTFDSSNVIALVFFTDKKSSSGQKHCDSPVYIEASLGFYLGVRAGFSFSEFLDFLMGFSTYDLMEDDSID
ncbi:MAG: hypothetical protein O9264_03040 [Leptospira sp.]|nr:hypothetical protein [Leptospira sp.]